MTRVALVSSEPLRKRMAGIGIRYLEMAKGLAREGLEVLLLSPGSDDGSLGLDLGTASVEAAIFEPSTLAADLVGCSVVVAQGQLANEVIHRVPGLPLVIDLYDPWLIENLHYAADLGLDPYRNDHATWVLQLGSGDFFLCSSDEQRSFYLGFLAALGRVNPQIVAADPTLEGLIGVVPFGQPEELPSHRAVLGERKLGERRLLFGGLYDWYDPWPLLDALERLDWSQAVLYLVSNPNPGNTPQRLMKAVEEWSRRRGWWQSRVQVVDWLPFERRFDLLRDVDLLVATHRQSLETRLSMRTRFLDALRVGLPVLTTEGGAVSRLVAEHRAGWVVAQSDPDAIAEALTEIFDHSSESRAELERRTERGQELARGMIWRRALEPLVRFCREPMIDRSKEEFAQRLPTNAPPDSLLFRVRRRLRRVLKDAGLAGAPPGGRA